MSDDSETTERKAPAFNSMAGQVKRREWMESDWLGVSLTEMWRASGLPTGHAPQNWAFESAELFSGLSTYCRGIYPDNWWGETPEQIYKLSHGLLSGWFGEGSGPDDWLYGDITTPFEVVAAAYAMWLDEKVDENTPSDAEEYDLT